MDDPARLRWDLIGGITLASMATWLLPTVYGYYVIAAVITATLVSAVVTRRHGRQPAKETLLIGVLAGGSNGLVALLWMRGLFRDFNGADTSAFTGIPILVGLLLVGSLLGLIAGKAAARGEASRAP